MYNDQLAKCGAAANATLTGPTSTQQVKESVYAAQALDRALSNTESLISELTQRLAPVLENRPQAESSKIDKVERAMYSAIGKGLMETSNRVELLNGRILSLLDLLAI